MIPKVICKKLICKYVKPIKWRNATFYRIVNQINRRDYLLIDVTEIQYFYIRQNKVNIDLTMTKKL